MYKFTLTYGWSFCHTPWVTRIFDFIFVLEWSQTNRTISSIFVYAQGFMAFDDANIAALRKDPEHENGTVICNLYVVPGFPESNKQTNK